MKKVFGIFKNDIKKLFRNVIAFILAIGLSVLPALYAWFNIAANWDPYANTADIPIAVVNLDKGYNIKLLTLNVGEQLEDNLRQNTQMRWTFVDLNDAMNGVESGEYYAAVVVDENFSEDLMSVTSGELKKPKITYYLNQKKNAIAPKITDKGVTAIEKEINSSYVAEVTKIIATVMNISKDDVSDNKEEICDTLITDLDNIKSDLKSFGSNFDVLSASMDNINDIIESNRKALPDISKSLENSGKVTADVKKAADTVDEVTKEITDIIDEIIKSTETSFDRIDAQINDVFDGIENGSVKGGAAIEKAAAYADGFVDDNNKIKALINNVSKAAGSDLDSALKSIDNINKKLNTLSTKLKEASKKVESTGKLPQETHNEIKALIGEVSEEIKDLEKQSAKIDEALKSAVEKLDTFNKSFNSQLNAIFKEISTDASSAAEKLSNLTKINRSIIAVNNSAISVIEGISNITGIDNSKLISALQGLNSKQEQMISKINSASNTIKATGSLPLQTQQEILQLASSITDDISQIKKAVGTSKATFASAIADLKNKYNELDKKLTSAFDGVENSAENIAATIENLANDSKSLIDINNKASSALKNIAEVAQTSNDNIISKLTAANKSLQNVADKLSKAAKTLKETGDLPQNIRSEIKESVRQVKVSISEIKNVYDSKAKNTIKEAMNKAFGSLDNISELLGKVNEDLPDIDEKLKNTEVTVGAVKSAIVDLQKVMDNGIGKIDRIKSKIEDFKNNSKLSDFVQTVFENPDELSKFISGPVDVVTEEVYPVDTYGSGMAPFYTVLSFWVGGIVLVAVMKTDLSKRDRKKIQNTGIAQEYFGRYLIFLLLSLVQATITALGDILIIHIQCENIFLFILASWISAIVFSLIIYSMTYTFGVIGKALAVIILVLQIAGSGGTFPYQLLPNFFQALYPYMPFNYAINALREATAGVHGNDYLTDILCLLAFIPIAILIGWILKRPTKHAMEFFNKRVEETDLIV